MVDFSRTRGGIQCVQRTQPTTPQSSPDILSALSRSPAPLNHLVRTIKTSATAAQPRCQGHTKQVRNRGQLDASNHTFTLGGLIGRAPNVIRHIVLFVLDLFFGFVHDEPFVGVDV
jgi:hypothetical protein